MEGANVCRFAAGFRFDQPLASWLDDSDFLFHAGVAGRGGAHGSTSLYGRFAVAAPDATGGDWTTTGAEERIWISTDDTAADPKGGCPRNECPSRASAGACN